MSPWIAWRHMAIRVRSRTTSRSESSRGCTAWQSAWQIEPADKLVPNLIQPTPDGLYCPAGDFYIDPWNPVTRAIVTHSHSDHARPGTQHI